MSKITLISFVLCPYAKKANIALRKSPKQVLILQGGLCEILRKNVGKDGVVPVLIDQDTYLAESEPIVWYVSQKFKNEGNNLIPENHVQRFKMRLFIEELSRKIITIQMKYFGWNHKSEQEKNKIKNESLQFLEQLNKRIIGPYALGEQFSIADVLIYPHLQMWSGIQHYTGHGIDAKYLAVHKYISEIQKRKPVSDLVISKQKYIQAFKKYF